MLPASSFIPYSLPYCVVTIKATVILRGIVLFRQEDDRWSLEFALMWSIWETQAAVHTAAAERRYECHKRKAMNKRKAVMNINIMCVRVSKRRTGTWIGTCLSGENPFPLQATNQMSFVCIWLTNNTVYPLFFLRVRALPRLSLPTYAHTLQL